MVEIPDNNIDTKLGVKNLLVSNGNSNINKPTLLPIAKSRNSLETANNNNGSHNNIIYAQSNILRNGFNSSNSSKGNISTISHNKLNFDNRPKEIQYATSHHANKTNGVSYTFNGIGSNNITQQSHNNVSDSNSNNQSTTTYSKLVRHTDILKQTSRTTKEHINTLNSPKNNNHNSKDDLNVVNNSNKWSNGSSDILF